MRTPPNSPEWQREAERYDVNSIIVPLGRYDGLALFPVLHDFCESQSWRPVYLDEVSAVFVRRRPETEDLIRRLQIDCATAPLPAVAPPSRGAKAFNQWANAAAVLRALGRNRESFAATTQALTIFPDSAFANFLKGNLLEVVGDFRGAEQQYRLAARLDPRVAVIWFTLARLYQREGRLAPAIDAWKYAADVADQPWTMLLSLGQAELGANRPQQALQAFDQCANSLPSLPSTLVDDSFLSNLAYSRAVAWNTLGKTENVPSNFSARRCGSRRRSLKTGFISRNSTTWTAEPQRPNRRANAPATRRRMEPCGNTRVCRRAHRASMSFEAGTYLTNAAAELAVAPRGYFEQFLD